MKKILFLTTASLLLLTQAAYAIDLKSVKADGLVGETTTGYLAAVRSPSTETKALIKTVNLKRKQKYQEIATRNKTSLQSIEELAGKKAIEKSQSGSYVKLDGRWQKK